MSRNLLISFVAICVSASLASAADLPSRKEPPPPPEPVMFTPVPVTNWTGFYVGAQTGVVWATDYLRGDAIPAGTYLYSATLLQPGATLEGFVGYNWQMSNGFVLGAEGDFGGAWAKLRTTTFTPPTGAPAFTGASAASEWINSQGSLRGRVGYGGGQAMIYVTGGAAVANITRQYVQLAAPGVPGSNQFTSWRLGWTVGAGVAYMFASNWIGRI